MELKWPALTISNDHVLAEELLATGTVCVAGEPPGVGPAEAMNLNFSTWHLLESDDVQTVWLPMLDELKSRTNGSVTSSPPQRMGHPASTNRRLLWT